LADNPLVISNADITGLLKNVYESYRINCFPKSTVLLANIKKASPGGPERMQWGGNGVFFDVVLNRPVGMTASDTGYFPPTAQAIERQATLGIKRTYVSRQVDSLAIQGTQSKEAAYIPLVRKIMQEAMDAAQLGQNEVLHGNGLGIKGIISSSADTTHCVVTSPFGIVGAGRGGLLLDVGMYIAVLDTTGATVRGKATITAAANSGDNVTLTLDTAIAGMVSTDIIVAATVSDTSYNAMPNGLTNILNRGGSYNNFQGINASSFARWDTLRLTAGTDVGDAAAPSEMDIWELATRLANRSGKNPMTNPKEFLLLTTPGIAKKLGESFLGQRQFQMQEKVQLKGGFSGISVCGLPLVQDGWCPAGTLYLVHLPSLTWVDRQDWVKLSYEDSGPWRFISGRDAYEVNFGSYWNFGVLQRNAHAMITGYTDTSRYDHVM
jgi:hypothetical protein